MTHFDPKVTQCDRFLVSFIVDVLHRRGEYLADGIWCVNCKHLICFD